MSQSRVGSLVESLSNVAIGFSVNYIANLLIFPLFGMHISLANNFLMGLIYTAISIARSFCLRRLFNAKRWFPQPA